MTGETKVFASQCKLRKGLDGRRNYDVHRVNYLRAMTRTVLFEAPKSWNVFKDFFIPRRYFNQLDTISNVMY